MGGADRNGAVMRFAFPGSPESEKIKVRDAFTFSDVELSPEIRVGAYILESIEPGVIKALADMVDPVKGFPVGQDYSDLRHYATAQRKPLLEISGVSDEQFSEKFPTPEAAARLAAAAAQKAEEEAAAATAKAGGK